MYCLLCQLALLFELENSFKGLFLESLEFKCILNVAGETSLGLCVILMRLGEDESLLKRMNHLLNLGELSLEIRCQLSLDTILLARFVRMRLIAFVFSRSILCFIFITRNAI